MKLLIASALFIVFSGTCVAGDRVIAESIFAITARGVTVREVGDNKKPHTLVVEAKIRVTPNDSDIRVFQKEGVTVELLKDGKPFGERQTVRISATTAEDTGQYLKFESGSGKFLSISVPFFIRHPSAGKYEAKIVEIKYHHGTAVLTFKPTDAGYKASFTK